MKTEGTTTLASALEREHRQIDGGIEQFVAQLGSAGTPDAAPLRDALGGLRRHIYLEEKFLFPPLREAGMMMPIMVMQREHGQLWDSMDAIDALLVGDTANSGLLDACRTLLSQLDAHNSKEEPIIYSRADDTLTAEASEELHTFLASGQLPEAWVPHEW